MSKFHPMGLSKRQLYKAVCASTPGSEAHLAGVKSFHKVAWECFELRKAEPIPAKTEYIYTASQGGTSTRAARATQPTAVDPRTKKAILALERDCEFCWHELRSAVNSWRDGTRAKIKAIDALSKWQKDYHARWDRWLARGKRKLPAQLNRLKEFADTHGQVHFLAGEERYVATAKEAQRYREATENHRKAADAMQHYYSETNQRLIELFDKAMDNPELWEEFNRALTQVEADDDDDDTQERDEVNDESEA